MRGDAEAPSDADSAPPSFEGLTLRRPRLSANDAYLVSCIVGDGDGMGGAAGRISPWRVAECG